MEPFHTSERAIFYHGNCKVVMAEMEESSVDAIVTDPPYEWGFMGKSWDKSGIAYDVEMWRQCLRALKPGGHLLSFGGSRTYHRMACAVEDAGFEIRDQMMWIFGSGFPKSLDLSRSIDKAAGAKREVVGISPHAKCASNNRNLYGGYPGEDTRLITSPVTDDTQKWSGWGTALKPAHEPVVVARKPLIGTVVANVLTHGTGALNIDGCRIPGEPVPINRLEQWSGFGQEKRPDYEQEINNKGRWPSNIVHDGSDEVLALFPSTSPSSLASAGQAEYKSNHKNNVFGEGMGGGFHPGFGDGGSAARFFYTAKASKEDRDEGLDSLPLVPCGMMEDDEYDIKTGSGNSRDTQRRNHHPTVKPTDLMRYLCRLVTPPGGTVLDPFMGSGSTYKAAYQDGLKFVGIEIKEEYCEIAIRRVAQKVFDFGS